MDTEGVATDTPRPPVELVALLASAGGLDSLSIVLADLPTDFPAAVVVQQHLGGHSSVLPSILSGRTPHPVDWARDGQLVGPGQVLVCPPGKHMELKPDGCCSLREMNSPGEPRFDVLMTSLAGSYGARALAVVLSGSGHDGAEGTAAMKRVGAIVIAESPATAEYPSMPVAAAHAGADLVLRVDEIGRVLTDIIAGAPLPTPDRQPRQNDWTATSVDSLEQPAEETGEDAIGVGEPAVDMGEANTAHHDNRPRLLSPQRLIDSAAARAEAAAARADELRRRREELAAGRGATSQTVAIARRRAEEALRRAQLAHQAAQRAAGRSRD